MRFGLDFSSSELRSSDPEGYVGARVWLGAFSERVVCCTRIWSAADYQRHWRAATEQCVAGLSQVVFASDHYSDGLGNGWSLFVGAKSLDGYKFIQILSPLDAVRLDQQWILALRAGDVDLSEGASAWDVPMRIIQQSLA